MNNPSACLRGCWLTPHLRHGRGARLHTVRARPLLATRRDGGVSHVELTSLIAQKLRELSSVVLHYMCSMDGCTCTVSVLKIHTQKSSVIYCVTAAVVSQRVAPPQGSWWCMTHRASFDIHWASLIKCSRPRVVIEAQGVLKDHQPAKRTEYG